MSYFVSVFNRYTDGSVLNLEFDTESVMVEDALIDAEIEVFTHRMHNQQNYNERPLIQQVSLLPSLSFRR